MGHHPLAKSAIFLLEPAELEQYSFDSDEVSDDVEGSSTNMIVVQGSYNYEGEHNPYFYRGSSRLDSSINESNYEGAPLVSKS